MTDSKKDLNTPVYTNADLNLDLERAAKRKLESKQPTDTSSSGATHSCADGCFIEWCDHFNQVRKQKRPSSWRLFPRALALGIEGRVRGLAQEFPGRLEA